MLGGGIRFLTDQQLEIEGHRAARPEEFEPGTPSSGEKEARRRLCEFVRRAYRQRLFISTQGSFSARVAGGAFLITPYQVDRGAVEVEDLVLVRGGRHESG